MRRSFPREGAAAALNFHGSSCDPAISSHVGWLGNHTHYWFACACRCKTFPPRPQSVLNSPPRLGNDYFFPQDLQVVMPTWQCDSRGRSWRKIPTHPRLGSKDPATTRLPPKLPGVGLLLLKQFLPPVPVPLARCGLQGAQQILAAVINPGAASMMLKIWGYPNGSGSGPDLCGMCCKKSVCVGKKTHLCNPALS